MIIKRLIGEKGQIVIPIDARKQFNLNKGKTVQIEITKEDIRIKPEQDKMRLLKEFFVQAKTKSKDITLKELKKIEDESYDLP